MSIALCQINSIVADFEGNAGRIFQAIQTARRKKATLCIFPELTTFGYPPRDLLDRPYLVEANIRLAEKIARATDKHFGIIFGYVARNLSPTGRGLQNVACFAYGGAIRQQQAKSLLPTYDVFDEARHFDPATENSPHLFEGVCFGLTVCEDIWFAFDFDGKKYYASDPVAVLKRRGAQCLVNISASPFHRGKRDIRREVLSETAKKHSLPILYCNLVGGNDELVFDGQSMAVDAAGNIVFEAKRFQEEVAVVSWPLPQKPARPANPSDIEEIFEALRLGLKDYARKCGFTKAILGLSGGIDSSVVAVLAADVFGPKSLFGVSLPSPYSSKGSLRDAALLAKQLKIRYSVIPIHTIYEAYLQTLGIDTRKGVSLAAENIQARIRGNILMALSNQHHGLVLSTGNKSELACGYGTLYGDLAGGLALLSDLPKTDVYRLARFLNRKRKLIPEAVLRKAPSAELKPDQKDQDTLPAYPVLDKILKAYVEEHRSLKEIVAMGFHHRVVQDVLRRVDHNEYKRRQAPPGIKITSKAFGMGRRFPIAWGCR